MGTKNNPGVYDALDKADPDEPRFLLLARDPQAPLLIRQWARDRRLRSGKDDPKVLEALAVADAMDAWRGTSRPLEQDIPKDGEHVPDAALFRTDYRNNVPPERREAGIDPYSVLAAGITDVVASGDPVDKTAERKVGRSPLLGEGYQTKGRKKRK